MSNRNWTLCELNALKFLKCPIGDWTFCELNLFSPRKYTGRTQKYQQIYMAHPYYQNTILPGRALSVMVNFRMTRIPYTTPVSQDVPRLLGHCSRVFLQLLRLSATASAAVIYDEAPTASYRVMPVT